MVRRYLRAVLAFPTRPLDRCLYLVLEKTSCLVWLSCTVPMIKTIILPLQDINWKKRSKSLLSGLVCAVWEVESGSSPELSGEALGRAGIQF